VIRLRAAIPATRKQVKTKKFGNFFLPKNLPIPKKITYFALCFVAPP
jgi:hypothetical protein